MDSFPTNREQRAAFARAMGGLHHGSYWIDDSIESGGTIILVKRQRKWEWTNNGFQWVIAEIGKKGFKVHIVPGVDKHIRLFRTDLTSTLYGYGKSVGEQLFCAVVMLGEEKK